MRRQGAVKLLRWYRVVNPLSLSCACARAQLVLYKAEMGSYFGKRDIFRDHAKFVFSDFYQQHFHMRKGRMLLLTSQRVMMVQVGHSRTAASALEDMTTPHPSSVCLSLMHTHRLLMQYLEAIC